MHLTISEAVLQTIILPMDELPQFFELLNVVTGQKAEPTAARCLGEGGFGAAPLAIASLGDTRLSPAPGQLKRNECAQKHPGNRDS